MKDSTQAFFPIYSIPRLSGERGKCVSCQHTPTRCMIKGSYLCLFQENPTTVMSAVTTVCVHVYIYLPSLLVTTTRGKAWKLWEFAHRLFQFFCLLRKWRKGEAFLSFVPGKRKGFHPESSGSQRRCWNSTTEKEKLWESFWGTQPERYSCERHLTNSLTET